jgi:hypothetical protein
MIRIFAAALLMLGILGVQPAAARDMQFSGHGVTLIFHMPDAWFTDPDPNSTMVLKSPDHSAAITISIIDAAEESDDDVAGFLLGALHADPPQKDKPMHMSGRDGYRYISSIVNSHGVHANIRLTVVHADVHAVVVCMAVFQDNMSAEQQTDVDTTIDSLGVQPI